MPDIKFTIGKNIAELRKSHGMTQLELAEKLSYSDKAISKWERGEVTTDILVLKEVANIFGVTLDYLMEEEHKKKPEPETEVKGKLHNRGLITGICILLVWVAATFAFVTTDIITVNVTIHWLAFVYAVPLSMVMWLIFNSIWFKKHTNFLIVSILMWTALAAVYITLLVYRMNLWQLFFLGAPCQIIIIMWSKLRYKKK